MDNPWAYDFDHAKQPRYQPVVDRTYWLVLGYLDNWDIIKFTNKTALSEEFDAMHKVVLDGISDNMEYLVHRGIRLYQCSGSNHKGLLCDKIHI